MRCVSSSSSSPRRQQQESSSSSPVIIQSKKKIIVEEEENNDDEHERVRTRKTDYKLEMDPPVAGQQEGWSITVTANEIASSPSPIIQ